MTQIILHGGYRGIWENAGCDLPLFEKLAQAARNADNKLMISFCAHKTPEDFPHLDELRATFAEIASDIELVIAGRANFRELLPQYQVLFLQGGTSGAHFEFMADISKEEIARNKKTLAGSSSGGMLLCNYGYSRSSGGPVKGKGIVDLALMPHADVWNVDDFIPRLREVTKSSLLLLDEMQIVELNINA